MTDLKAIAKRIDGIFGAIGAVHLALDEAGENRLCHDLDTIQVHLKDILKDIEEEGGEKAPKLSEWKVSPDGYTYEAVMQVDVGSFGQMILMGEDNIPLAIYAPGQWDVAIRCSTTCDKS